MIPFRLILAALGAVAAVSALAWLRHDATLRERGRQAQEQVNTLTRAEEARRAADAHAVGAADPAGELRARGALRD
jgi:hypothetical protein